MIRHIALRNWRAYDHLELSLTRPVTFLVAANGVGKSSLVEAVRWAVLGMPADRDRGRAVRGGHDEATVTVHLALPKQVGQDPQTSDLTSRDQRLHGVESHVGHGRELESVDDDRVQVEVTRTLRRNGASTFIATMAGEDLPEDQFLTVLSQAWTADVGLLDSIIFGPTITAKSTGFPIRDHLAAVFGIEPLLRASAAVKSRRDAITAHIRTLRDDLSGTDEAIAAARESVDVLRDALDQAETDRSGHHERVLALQRSARQSLAWQHYRDQAISYRQRTQALLAEMSSTLADPGLEHGDDAHAALLASRVQAESALDVARAASTEADLLAARSTSAAQLLSSAVDVCPTCLRPLSAAEKESALGEHDRHGSNAHDQVATFEQQTATARSQLNAITRFSDALARLQVPVEPEHDDPGPDAPAAVGAAQVELQHMDQDLGGLRERLHAAERLLDDLETAAADHDELNRAAAQDMTLEMTQRSLTAVIDRLLSERVEPMTTEIAHRWKLLFGSEGLQLAPDGQLHLTRSDIELKLADLSGGERATALLVTRIILAASATRASTLWLDEPLEHLDPSRRASVAQTLVRAAQTGTVDQIVVTTYEEGLARRLQATAPNVVQLTYARSTTDSEDL